jgi:dihydroorotate dehydrogenase (NAD+) catalytic subunit
MGKIIVKKINLAVNLAGLKLANPTILASGILGLHKQMLQVVINSGAGAVTSKSITLEPKKGHNNPIVVQIEKGFLNAVGYANPGFKATYQEFETWEAKTPLIFSIVAPDTQSFSHLAQLVETLPNEALEVVLSCPHTPGLGLMAGHGTTEATFAITQAVRAKTKKILSVKISPSLNNVGEIAKAAEAAGADIINMGNTLGPGMVIDIKRHQPVLDFKVGGMSGPAIRPVSLRCVYDIYQAIKIPIIGTGGITTGADAVAMFMAGAQAVGIGTGIYYRGIKIFKKICQEIKSIMEEQGFKKVSQMIGLAH